MGNLFRQILALFGAFLGICEHIKLFLYSKNAIKKQEKPGPMRSGFCCT